MTYEITMKPGISEELITKHTLSFAIIDDMRQLSKNVGYGPVHIQIPDTKKETLEKAIRDIAKPFLKYIDRRKNLNYEEIWSLENLSDEEIDPTRYYFEDFFEGKEDDDVNDAVKNLHYNGSHYWNHFEKYYVIAYAIDFKTFEICSKDNEPELIKWF